MRFFVSRTLPPKEAGVVVTSAGLAYLGIVNPLCFGQRAVPSAGFKAQPLARIFLTPWSLFSHSSALDSVHPG